MANSGKPRQTMAETESLLTKFARVCQSLHGPGHPQVAVFPTAICGLPYRTDMLPSDQH